MKALLVAVSLLAAGSAFSQDGRALLEAKGCLGCHAFDAAKVGPPFNDVAAKYKDDRHAEAKLVAKLKAGEGHPIKVEASDAELSALVKTVLAAAAAGKPAVAKAAPAEKGPTNPNNALCLGCHGNPDFTPHIDAAAFEKSVHAPRNCTDCHGDMGGIPHTKIAPSHDARSLAIIKNCGGCHTENLKSYRDTYHGQVTTLGYAFTAKCFDCHGTHNILHVKDPASSVHPNNRLHTCQKCHVGATPGFVTFQPHANHTNLQRYPYTYLAWHFMAGLLLGTFAFFWTHSALWFYREYRDRREGKLRTHVATGELALPPGKRYQRFNGWWRLAHLVFALTLMVLTLTGMTLFYAHSAWAPEVSKALGGPRTTGLIHRVAAVMFAAVFIAHLGYMLVHLGRRWRTFNWLGPDSLIPWIQDFKDIWAMFKWFIGKGPRPVFDRWTYWEKFDYWAPFWGVTIIGVSGLMLWFPKVTAFFLPGWTFNVAMIAHGEEAFLAAVFLFTVHFFNNHFRPEKFPLDTLMFTGSMPIELFKHEHGLHYERLVRSGELQRYLVQEPSRPMALGSKILGFTLIGIGLALLALVLIGFST